MRLLNIKHLIPANTSGKFYKSVLAIVCFLLFLSLVPLGAQEYSDIFLATLPIDIRNSDFLELVNWCRRLGLDSSGRREALERRLYSHYGLEYEPSEEVPPRLVIERAGIGGYSGTEEGSEYIRLTGEVRLEMHDEENNEKHIITADQIIFNEENDSVTAIGSIEYILDKGDVQEVFSGERLTFNVDHWGGIFFDGVTEREEEIDDKPVVFRFSGEQIIRNSTGKILLEKGTITSSKKIDPYYHIRSSKIWVFDEGEWVLEHPVLYVGRVPMLYFPFFFKQKDDIFFNPSFGVDDKGNAFLFTTYYIFGQKEEEDEGSFSFMNLGSTAENDGPKKRRGLFLVDDPEPSSFGKDIYDWAKETGSYSKLMLDYYSTRGVFSSLDTEVSAKGNSGSLWLGAASSFFPRTSPSGIKSLYWPNSGNPVIVQEQTWAFGRYLPVRWGMDLDADLSFKDIRLSIQFPWYSDPFFRRVFDDRYETIQWGKIVGLDEAGFEEIDLDEKDASPFWELSGSYNLKTPGLQPYLNGIQIKKLAVSAQLREGYLDRNAYTDAEIGERINRWDVISSSNVLAYPGMYFYYLHSMNTPEVSLSMNGGLIAKGQESESEEEGEPEESVTPPRDLIPPWEDGSISRDDEPQENFKPPEEGRDIQLPAVKAPAGLSQSLSYTFNPTYRHEGYFNTSQYGSGTPGLYRAPWEVENDILYSRDFMKFDPVLTYKISLLDSTLSFQERVSVNRQMNIISTDMEEDIPSATWDTLQLDEKRQTFTTADHSFTATFRMPLSETSGLSNTTRYQFSDQFYSYIYDEDSPNNGYVERLFDMDKDSISSHHISNSFQFSINDWNQTITADYYLPPDLEKFSYAVKPTVGPLRFNLSHGIFEEDEDKWRSSPLDLDMSGSFDSGLSFSQKFISNYGSASINEEDLFDLRSGRSTVSWKGDALPLSLSNTFDYRFNTEHNGEKDSFFPYSNTSKLTLGPLSTSYIMKDQYGYEYVSGTGWVQDPSKDFLPDSFSLGYNKTHELPSLWKRRIDTSLKINSNTKVVFQKFSQSTFTFELTYLMSIAEFLDFSLTSRSENKAIYLYFPYFTDQVGIERVDPVQDLFDSFNYADRTKRESSNFNLNSLSFNLVHHMRDWTFSLSYEGVPEAVTTGGIQRYEWESTLTFLVSWTPIPEIEREASYEDDRFSF